MTVALACGADTKPPSTPTATPATPTIEPTPEPFGLSLLYREFGPTADVVWRVSPSDPGRKERIATLRHAPNWGTFISLSPAGDAIAYTLLPETARNQRGEAQAWVLDLGHGQRTLVARDVDLLTPLWSPDSKFIYLRRNSGDSIEVIEIDLATAQERSVWQQPASEVADLLPIGFAADGTTLYYVQIGGSTQTTASLGAVSVASGEGDILMRLSDQAARDFALSPDGRRLLFFSQGVVNGRFALRSILADIDAGTVVPLPATGLAGDIQLHPIWHPQGDNVSVGQGPLGDEPGAVANIPLPAGSPSFLPPPERGFDIPHSWAPDGSYLVVRSFQGDSLSEPGQALLVLISREGQRTLVTDETGAEPVGWMP